MNLEDLCMNQFNNLVYPSCLVSLFINKRKLHSDCEVLQFQEYLKEEECKLCTKDKLCIKHKTLKSLKDFSVVYFDTYTNFFIVKNLIFRQCKNNVMICVAKNIMNIKKISHIDHIIYNYYDEKIPTFLKVQTFHLIDDVIKKNPIINTEKFSIQFSLSTCIRCRVFEINSGNKIFETYY